MPAAHESDAKVIRAINSLMFTVVQEDDFVPKLGREKFNVFHDLNRIVAREEVS